MAPLVFPMILPKNSSKYPANSLTAMTPSKLPSGDERRRATRNERPRLQRPGSSRPTTIASAAPSRAATK